MNPSADHFLYSVYTIHDWRHKIEDDDSLETFFEFKQAVSAIVIGGDLKTMTFPRTSLRPLTISGSSSTINNIFLIICLLFHISISN